ncbi:MAG: sodium-dependent bicarbonate transport family permease [Planctomycetota bacterium]|nr:sodium-dependent bicarbonate transport family permease [Planctomycetota bacterium]
MDLLEAIRHNLLSPAPLFFALGLLAAAAKSDLKLPEALYSSLTIYLLAAIGFKGGAAIQEAGLGVVWLPVLVAAVLSAAIPLWTYPVLRFLGRFPASDAASIAAHYGSVSAVTFTVATGFLANTSVPYEGYSSALLAIMESPAILVGVLLGKMTEGPGNPGPGSSLREVLREALLGKSVVLLVGALLIGFLCGKSGLEKVGGFFVAPFQGVLALFLLELGLVAGRRLRDLRRAGPFLIAFGVLIPVVHGAVGVAIGLTIGLSPGGATLLGTLCASASYIAAPAAMRLALPDANPTLSLAASLAITFPFNVSLGIPLYHEMAMRWSTP